VPCDEVVGECAEGQEKESVRPCRGEGVRGSSEGPSPVVAAVASVVPKPRRVLALLLKVSFPRMGEAVEAPPRSCPCSEKVKEGVPVGLVEGVGKENSV